MWFYLSKFFTKRIYFYRAEAMINMKQDHYRKIEQIKEDQMRLLFKTDRSFSIHLMYLGSGQVSARFQINRMGQTFTTTFLIKKWTHL